MYHSNKETHESKYNRMAVSRLNAEVEEGGEERKEKRAVNLWPA